MKTYKTVQDFLDSYEYDRDTHISDDGVVESETEYLFQVEKESVVFCLLTTQFDICAGEFSEAYHFINANGGITHSCSEWRDGSQEKTGYIVYQHPSQTFRSSVEDIFY